MVLVLASIAHIETLRPLIAALLKLAIATCVLNALMWSLAQSQMRLVWIESFAAGLACAGYMLMVGN